MRPIPPVGMGQTTLVRGDLSPYHRLMWGLWMGMQLLLLMVLQAHFLKAEPSCEHSPDQFRCVKYLRNYDGDTLTVEIPEVHPLLGEKISVRIANIDTAEVRGKAPCEKDSARTAKRLVHATLKQAKTIELRRVQRDKYFRILAEVWVDGRSLQDILIQNRLAVAYGGGTKTKVDWCEMGKRQPAEKKPN